MRWHDARIEPPPLGKLVLLKMFILEGFYFKPDIDYQPNWLCEDRHFGTFTDLPFYITLDEIEKELEQDD